MGNSTPRITLHFNVFSFWFSKFLSDRIEQYDKDPNRISALLQKYISMFI